MLQPLTDKEIEFIQWRVWEPLRRNEDYINDYHELQNTTPTYSNEPYELTFETPAGDVITQTIDTVKEDNSEEEKFCEDWKLSCPLPPELDFNELFEPDLD